MSERVDLLSSNSKLAEETVYDNYSPYLDAITAVCIRFLEKLAP